MARRNRFNRVAGPLLLLTVVVLPFREVLVPWFPWLPLVLVLFVSAQAAAGLLLSSGTRFLPPVAWVFAGWILVETLLASDWDRSVGLAGTWGMGLLLWFVSRSIVRGDATFPRKLCITLWCCATVIATLNPTMRISEPDLDGALQDAAISDTFHQALLHAAAQDRYNFPFGNPIHLGLFLSLSLLAVPCLHGIARRQTKPFLWFGSLYFTAGVQAYVLWGTRSRTSLLALLVGALFWIVALWGARVWVKKQVLVACAGITFALAATLLALPAGREMLERVETVRARLIYWEIASRMIRDHPAVGLGIGGYGGAYTQYRGFTTHQTRFPHNVFVEVMTDTGAVGLLLFLLLLSTNSHLSMRSYKGNTGNLGSNTAGEPSSWRTACLLAFGTAMQLDFPHNMLYLCGIVGAIAGTKADPAAHPDARWRLPISRIWLVAFVCVFGGILSTREIGHARFELAQAAWKDGMADVTIQHLEASLGFWPPLSDAEHYLGRLLQDLGDLKGAEKHLRRAIYWSPGTPFMHEDLATLLWSDGRKEEARRSLDKAIRLHPVKWQYHQKMSYWLHQLGDNAGAASERKKAETLRRYEPDYRQVLEDQKKVREGS
jgi:O-antigen ligase/Tfp pilus assembly protein PilF